MPVQKGKRRKRTRRRGRGEGSEPLVQSPNGTKPGEAARSRPARRGRWQPPLWFNLLVGLSLLGLGLLFSLTPAKGLGPGLHFIFLLGYLALSALYLGRAFRQYREKQGS